MAVFMMVFTTGLGVGVGQSLETDRKIAEQIKYIQETTRSRSLGLGFQLERPEALLKTLNAAAVTDSKHFHRLGGEWAWR